MKLRLLLVLGGTLAYTEAVPLLAAPTKPTATVEQATAAQIVERAQKLVNDKDFAGAATLLETRLKAKLDSQTRITLGAALADVQYGWGLECLRQKDGEGTYTHFQNSWLFNKDHRPALAARDANNLGILLFAAKAFPEAVPYFEQELALRRQLKNQPGEIMALANLSWGYSLCELHEKALQTAKAMLLLYNSKPEFKQIPQLLECKAMALCAIGKSYQSLSLFNESVRWNTYSLNFARSPERKDRLNEAQALANIGLAYTSLGRYQDGLRFSTDALAITRQQGFVELEGILLNNMGLCYRYSQRFQEALETLNEAVPILEKNGNERELPLALSNIGEIHFRLGRFDEAEKFYLLALKRAHDQNSQATVFNNIGLLYDTLERPQDALPYYLKALPLFQTLHNQQGVAITLSNIGLIYQSLQLYDKALEFYERALPITRAINAPAEEARMLANVGLVYDSQQKPAQALKSYVAALAICRRIHDRMGEALTLANMMELYWGNQPELAIFYGKQAVNVTQSIRRTLVGLDRASQDSFFKHNAAFYRDLVDLLVAQGRLPEAEQVLRMIKQDEFLDFVRRDATRAGLSEKLALSPAEEDTVKRYDALLERIGTLGARIAELELKKSSARTPEEKAEYTRLLGERTVVNGRFEVFIREVATAFAGTARQADVEVRDSQSWQSKLADIERAGDGRAAVIYTLVAPHSFKVIVLTASTRQGFSFPIEDADFNKKVAVLRAALTNPTEDPVPAARDLYDVVFCKGEVAATLDAQKIDHALWFLDGTLRLVPLDALHDGQGYLLEKERTNTILTLASRNRLGEDSRVGDMLALGVSKPHTSVLDPRDPALRLGFDALPSVPAEVRGIVNDPTNNGNGPVNGQILLDEAFTADSLATALGDHPRDVHIASHFNLVPGDESASFLLLGNGTPLPMAQWRTQMDLSGVDLLTLSACQTAVSSGGRKSAGSEVDSLGEVAQQLGASTVVASLWPVSDTSTCLMMQAFYRLQMPDAQGTMPAKIVALRGAQRALLTGAMLLSPGDIERGTPHREGEAARFIRDPKRPYAHPYYWAPFTMIGNWR